MMNGIIGVYKDTYEHQNDIKRTMPVLRIALFSTHYDFCFTN